RRADEIGPFVIEGEQTVLIGREPKEITRLLDPFDRRSLRPVTNAILAQLGFLLTVISLVPDRIPAGVAALVDVAIGGHRLPYGLRGLVMTLFGGANEIVVGGVEDLGHALEFGGIAVGEFA